MSSQDSSWSGWIVFAAIVLVIVGALDILQGFVGILKDDYVIATAKGLAIVDVTTWGWMTLLWGVLLVLTGLGLLGGAGWAVGSPSSASPSTRSVRSRSWRTTPRRIRSGTS